MFEAVKQCSRR